MLKLCYFTWICCILLLFQGCQCDGYYRDETKYYQFVLSDSTNKILQVAYQTGLGRKEAFESGAGVQSVKWDLVISSPQTTVFITHQKGIDTLLYQLKTTLTFGEKNECSDEQLYYNMQAPDVISHTFDSVYFVPERTPYSYYSTDYLSLYLKP